ncbi:palmitoyl-protein thioesterase 1-like [Impatiens glandulifera]|uniref:palmitoyl-protein thioesterase 1-like n=1 Tax=Impatiens glandulifera TaxID=253017 RepID=UPI001FB18E6B|nr:palmitoyl-protein thioesterase 1-like [Impatiens glandulifera]
MAILIILALVFTSAYSLPFVVFHGLGDKCSNNQMIKFTNNLSNWSGSQGHCIETGDSWLVPIRNQVKSNYALSQGYNIVGLSQGNIIARAVIEFCEGGAPQVYNYVSLAGPHAGIAKIPYCGSGNYCTLVDSIIKSGVYSKYAQENFGPAGYIKMPTAINQYMKHCKFLPQLNNEYKDHKNAVYKERFASLQNLVLIMFENDKVLDPKETSWFGYFPDGSRDKVLSPQETALYNEDWIGLKSLDSAGRVQFINIVGGHLKISSTDTKKYIVPYLQNKWLFSSHQCLCCDGGGRPLFIP